MADGLSLAVNALQACLCEALADSPGGAVCRCCPTPGASAPMDGCCVCGPDTNGQASITVTEIYPSSRFPQRGIDQRYSACLKGGVSWAADLAVTVYRCIHTTDEHGAPPSCEETAGDAQLVWADAEVMRQVVSCCDWSGGAQFVPGVWRPVGPAGGCAGGSLSVVLNLGPDCCPDDQS